jgi:hypothetical protein
MANKADARRSLYYSHSNHKHKRVKESEKDAFIVIPIFCLSRDDPAFKCPTVAPPMKTSRIKHQESRSKKQEGRSKQEERHVICNVCK